MITLRSYQQEAKQAIKRIGKKVDRTGLRSGMLVAIRLAESAKNGGAQWVCRCDCGAEKVVTANNLIKGRAKSCGCNSNAFRVKACTKHGHTGTGWRSDTYSSWHAMIQRCENEKHSSYADYGGRGIRVCERWKSFSNFLADMGERPEKLSLDRIDPNGNYEPSNCKWSTRVEQGLNRRPLMSHRKMIELLNAADLVIVASSGTRSDLNSAIVNLAIVVNATKKAALK